MEELAELRRNLQSLMKAPTDTLSDDHEIRDGIHTLYQRVFRKRRAAQDPDRDTATEKRSKTCSNDSHNRSGESSSRGRQKRNPSLPMYTKQAQNMSKNSKGRFDQKIKIMTTSTANIHVQDEISVIESLTPSIIASAKKLLNHVRAAFKTIGPGDITLQIIGFTNSYCIRYAQRACYSKFRQWLKDGGTNKEQYLKIFPHEIRETMKYAMRVGESVDFLEQQWAGLGMIASTKFLDRNVSVIQQFVLAARDRSQILKATSSIPDGWTLFLSLVREHEEKEDLVGISDADGSPTSGGASPSVQGITPGHDCPMSVVTAGPNQAMPLARLATQRNMNPYGSGGSQVITGNIQSQQTQFFTDVAQHHIIEAALGIDQTLNFNDSMPHYIGAPLGIDQTLNFQDSMQYHIGVPLGIDQTLQYRSEAPLGVNQILGSYYNATLSVDQTLDSFDRVQYSGQVLSNSSEFM